jgi:hypothetical protein
MDTGDDSHECDADSKADDENAALSGVKMSTNIDIGDLDALNDDPARDDHKVEDHRFKEHWRFILANDPELFLLRFPETLKDYDERHIIGPTDAVLSNLSKAVLNGRPVVICDKVKGKDRFKVQLFDYTNRHSPISVKETNVRSLSPLPATKSFDHFKDAVEDVSWRILTRNGTSFDNDSIFFHFVEHQFPLYDLKAKNYKLLKLEKANTKYQKLRADTIREAKEKGLSVSKADSPKIIALLYSLSFSRNLHIVRTFSIPKSWQMQKWNDELYVPLPVSAVT